MANLYDYPESVIQEFSLEKNQDLDLTKLHKNHKYTWVCNLGHFYSTTLKKKEIGRGCHYCAGKIVLSGFNDLETKKPEIKDEFDIKRNNILPSQIMPNSHTEYWWICKIDKNHCWKAKASHRQPTKGFGECPYCSGRWAIPGINDVYSFAPELTKEIVIEKLPSNHTIETIKPTTSITFYCFFHSHYYKANLKRRKMGHGCIYCSGQKKKAGIDDITILFPKIVSEWDYQKNTIEPFGLSSGSSKKYWFLCELKHSYSKSLRNKTLRKQNCPYCLHKGGKKRVFKGFNDLESRFPEVSKEWDYIKNTVTPDTVLPFSQKNFNWKCKKCLTEWKAKIVERTTGSKNCPQCFCSVRRSRAEEDLFNITKKIVGSKIKVISNDRTVISPYEIDIYIPFLQKGIEYNGTYWHSDEQLSKRTGMTSKEFHYMKLSNAFDEEVELMHIDEKDWTENREKVLFLLKDFLKTPFGWNIVGTDTI